MVTVAVVVTPAGFGVEAVVPVVVVVVVVKVVGTLFSGSNEETATFTQVAP